MNKHRIIQWFFLVALLLLIRSYCAADASLIAGHLKTQLTLVEFMDYECPHCRHMAPVIDLLVHNNPNLRVVYRVMPAFGEASVFTDSAVMAAKLQDEKNYQCFRSLIISQVESPDPNSVLRLAKQSGLNVPQLLEDMRRPEINETLKSNLEMFYTTGQSSIPVILIGSLSQQGPSWVLTGEQPYGRLQAAIDQVNGVQNDQKLH